MYTTRLTRIDKNNKSIILGWVSIGLSVLLLFVGSANITKMTIYEYSSYSLSTLFFYIIIGVFSRIHERFHQKEAMKYGVNGRIIKRLFVFNENEYLTVQQCMRTLIAPFIKFNTMILVVGAILYLIGDELSIIYTLSSLMINLAASSSDIFSYFKLANRNKESKVFMKWDEVINAIPTNIYYVIEE